MIIILRAQQAIPQTMSELYGLKTGNLYLGIAIRDSVLSATKYYFTYQLFNCSPASVGYCSSNCLAMTIWKIACRKSSRCPRFSHNYLGFLGEPCESHWEMWYFSVFNLWLEYGKFVIHICRRWRRKAQAKIEINRISITISK